MAKKRSQPSRAVEPPEMDNLQTIDGIGPAIERRLHSIGIYTFAQLAVLSPADIAASVADIAGLTTERIIKQDWIGQARRMASKRDETPLQAEVSHQHIQAFQQEQPYEEVISSRVIDEPVEPIEVEPLRFQELADPIVKEAEPATFSTMMESIARLRESATILTSAKPAVKTRGLSGVLHLRDLEMLTAHPYDHRNIIRSNHPFKLRVTLDSRQVVTPDALLRYSASIYGKQFSSSVRQKMGEAQGRLMPACEVVVEVEGMAVIPGFYRLEVIVSLSNEGTSIPGLIAMIEGGPLQFY